MYTKSEWWAGILEVRMCISTQQRYKEYGVKVYWSVTLGTCIVYATQGFEPYFAAVNGNRSMDLEFTNLVTKNKQTPFFLKN